MNQIITINQSPALTMSSREIAELSGKRHDNVTTDVRKMLEDLGKDVLNFQGIYLDSMNRERFEFHLPKRETLILVSGYSVELRARIIDRWMELEEQHAKTQTVPVTATELNAMMERYMAAYYAYGNCDPGID